MAQVSRPAEALLGAVLAGRYRLESVLGRGGMGTVYRARDAQLEEDVALKLMAVESAQDVTRFQREVKLARRVTHPNVARTHDIGEHDGSLFLTMELVAGPTLDDLVIEGPLAPEEAVRIALAVARGLSAAHEAGVVHRDLKPGNVMLEPGGRVVITDFGIAKSHLESGAHTEAAIGTPRYMAPEQALGEPVSPQTDVYAFGLLLFEMLTARRPFSGETPVAEMLARCRGEAPDPAVLATLPEHLARLIRRCLELAPVDRLPSGEALAKEIEGWARASSAMTMAAESSSVVSQVLASAPFAPMVTSKRILAVMPFSYRGAADGDYLGDGLSQELIDVLSRTRGLRVLAFGATSAHRDESDPRAIGRRLGAEAVVTGAVTAANDRVRVNARLVDVATGMQLWTDRFEGGLDDLFDFQDIVSQRIADALRVELDAEAHRHRASAEAVDLYLRARRQARAMSTLPAETLSLLEQSLERSPNFGPALAAHAVASVRIWWSAIARGDVGAWAERAKESVERSVLHAPDLAESHLAHGMYALQIGDLASTASSLGLALEIAPTLAIGHRHLGELQTEAGRVEEGLRRLKLAFELDPSLHICLATRARVAALRGDDVAFERLIADYAAQAGETIPWLVLTMRVAAWRGDTATLRKLRGEPRAGETAAFIGDFAGFMLGEAEPPDLRKQLAEVSRFGNPRFVAVVSQVGAEGYALRGYGDEALTLLESAAATTCVDVEWLERCPALASLRSHPRFVAAAARMRERAAAIWSLR